MTWERFLFVSFSMVAAARFVDWRWPSLSRKLSSELIDYYFYLEGVEPRLILHKFGKRIHRWFSSRDPFLVAAPFGLVLFTVAVVTFAYAHPSGNMREAVLGPRLRYNQDGGDAGPFLGSQLLALLFAGTASCTAVWISVDVTRRLFGIIARRENVVLCLGVFLADVFASVIIGAFCFYGALAPLYEWNWAYPNGNFIHTLAAIGGLGSLLVSFAYLILLFVALMAYVPVTPGLRKFLLGTVDRIVSSSGGAITILAIGCAAIVGLLKLARNAGVII